MRSRPLLAAAVFYCCLVAHVGPARAAEIYAQLFPLTGEVRLVNRDAAPIPFVFYSITSAGGALDGNGAVWQTITGNYDASGNGLVDPDHNWFVLSDDPDELTEAVFSGPGGSLPPTRAISLGQIWNPFASVNPFDDLQFDVHDDTQPVPVNIELAIDGDYSLNQTVDQADYVLWREYLDSISMLLADGDLDGVIDQDDYLVWRENFGLTVPLPPYGTGSGGTLQPSPVTAAAAPEPTAAALAAMALGWWLIAAVRRVRCGAHSECTSRARLRGFSY